MTQFVVIGGDLVDTQREEFRDLSNVILVGAYPDYESARAAWRSEMGWNVDNAIRRYFILPITTYQGDRK